MVRLVARIMGACLLTMAIHQSALAFVERLNPHLRNTEGGGIPCGAMEAALWFHILPDGPSAVALGNILRREWMDNEEWSPQDVLDNTAFLTRLDGETAAEKRATVLSFGYLCGLWEMRVDEVNTPNRFRRALGIPVAVDPPQGG
jgi:hypothetical protein